MNRHNFNINYPEFINYTYYYKVHTNLGLFDH